MKITYDVPKTNVNGLDEEYVRKFAHELSFFLPDELQKEMRRAMKNSGLEKLHFHLEVNNGIFEEYVFGAIFEEGTSKKRTIQFTCENR